MLFAPNEKGQGLIEYAILLTLVALFLIALVRVMGPRIEDAYTTIGSSLP